MTRNMSRARPQRHARPLRKTRAALSQPESATAAQSEGEMEKATYDVAVIGGGPAGLSLAAALAQRSRSVVVLDGAIDRAWPNHYGVWRDEFEPVGLADCATREYGATAVYAGEEKMLLERGYLRVDRVMLKRRLIGRCEKGGGRLVKGIVTGVEHVCGERSEVGYRMVDSGETGGVVARVVVDCTGHGLRFTEKEEGGRYAAPWEQAAYGIEAEVEGYPYGGDEMLLMDFRDGHMDSEELKKMSRERPTFLYVFPMGARQAFFEETSVIQREAVGFDELKRRLYRRLEHDGVKVVRVIEEEESLIPMGGSLPIRGQRVVAFGGAACLVHPATGYMVARTVGMADRVAEAIAKGLENGLSGEEVGKKAWDVVWSLELRRQRDFLGFGAELLGVLDMDQSRGFFEAFFALPIEVWSRFLSYRLDGPLDRIYFALYFFMVAGWGIRVELLKAIINIGRWRLIRSCLPISFSRFDNN